MADVFVWHGGSNTSPYDTFAKAATTLATACGYGGLTDDICMADDHSEDPAGLVTFATGGTYLTGGRRLFSVNRTSGLPNPAQNPQVNNSTGDIYFSGDWVIENCWFRTQAGNIRGQSLSYKTRMYDCRLDITGVGNSLDILANSGDIFMYGGSVNHLTSSGTITRFIDITGSNSMCEFHGVTFTAATLVADFAMQGQTQGFGTFIGCDMSGVQANYLYGATTSPYSSWARFEDCELPTGLISEFNWALQGGFMHSEMAKILNCSSGQNRFNDYVAANAQGIVRTDRSIYRSANDAALSMKIDSTGNAYLQPYDRFMPVKLISLPIPENATTVEIEIARDGSSTPFTDHDIWPAVSRPKQSNNAHIWDRGGVASVLEGPNNWPTSSEAWDGLSGTNVKQTMSVSLTGSSKTGRGHIWVFFAVPNDKVYVDMKALVD